MIELLGSVDPGGWACSALCGAGCGAACVAGCGGACAADGPIPIRGTVTMDANGAATVTLTAVSTGEGIDCSTDSCVLKVFGDHAQNFADVTSVPVTFAH